MSRGEFTALKKSMLTEKNAITASRDTTAGSRTVPMGKEADDIVDQASGPIADLLKGRPGAALSKIGGRVYGRVVEGRTEAVNKRLAELLTNPDSASTAAYWRGSLKPKGDSPIAPRGTFFNGEFAPKLLKAGSRTSGKLTDLLGAETLRQLIASDDPKSALALARALMRANEQGAGR